MIVPHTWLWDIGYEISCSLSLVGWTSFVVIKSENFPFFTLISSKGLRGPLHVVSERKLQRLDLMDSSTCRYVVNYVFWLRDIVMHAIKEMLLNSLHRFLWAMCNAWSLLLAPKYKKDYLSSLGNKRMRIIFRNCHKQP